jgi:hypothetical protein
MSDTHVPNSLDVVDHFYDGNIHRLFESAVTPKHDELLELRDRLFEHYEHWVAPKPQPEECRLHFNTRPLRGFVPHLVPAVTIDYTDKELGSYIDESDEMIARRLRRKYTGALLFADTIVEVDPLSIWAQQFYEIDKGDEDSAYLAMYNLLCIVRGLDRLRAMLDAGNLILAPIPTPEETDTDVDAAARDTQHTDQSFDLSMWRRLALRICAKSHAALSAADRGEYQDFSTLVDSSSSALHASGIDLKVACALSEVELPMLSGLSLDTLLAIRQNEEAFTEWRSELRMAGRLLRASPSQEEFEKEAYDVFRDVLEPKAAAARRAVSRSHAMSEAAKEYPLQAVLSAGLASGLSAAAGMPVANSVIAGTAGAVAPVLAAGVAPPRPNGAAAIVAHMLDEG